MTIALLSRGPVASSGITTPGARPVGENITRLANGVGMQAIFLSAVIAAIFATSGCVTRSPSSTATIASTGTAWSGPTLVTQAGSPAGIDYKIIGPVQAVAQHNYDLAEDLYPLLANEAWKIGANVVMNVKSGRKVTGGSWSALYVSGTAVKIDDVQQFRSLSGTYY